MPINSQRPEADVEPGIEPVGNRQAPALPFRHGTVGLTGLIRRLSWGLADGELTGIVIVLQEPISKALHDFTRR